jgi:hypothetical protein
MHQSPHAGNSNAPNQPKLAPLHTLIRLQALGIGMRCECIDASLWWNSTVLGVFYAFSGGALTSIGANTGQKRGTSASAGRANTSIGANIGLKRG